MLEEILSFGEDSVDSVAPGKLIDGNKLRARNQKRHDSKELQSSSEFSERLLSRLQVLERISSSGEDSVESVTPMFGNEFERSRQVIVA